MRIFRDTVLMALVSTFVFSLSAMVSLQAEAGSYFGGGGRTALWVYIRKHPNEGIWEACRRVYRRDVYQVRGAGRTKARCFVDASEAGNPQGFNRSQDAY
jgi:hypothetical protein